MSKNDQNKVEWWKLIIGSIVAIAVVLIPLFWNLVFDKSEAPQFVLSSPEVTKDDKIIIYARNDSAERVTDAHIEWDNFLFKHAAKFTKEQVVKFSWEFSPKKIIKNKKLIDIGDHKLRIGFDNSKFSDFLHVSISEDKTIKISIPSKNSGLARASLLPDKPRKKHALIIGNSSYKAFQPLNNPIRDTELIANNLKALGFDINLYRNLSKEELKDSINNFSKKIGLNDIVVIYFSGHGVTMDGINYILPVDAEIIGANDIKLQGISTNELSKTIKGLKNQFIMYSTSPGSYALDGSTTNSPFATAVLHSLIESDELSSSFRKIIRDVDANTKGRQIPWVHSTATENIYLDRANSNIEANRSSSVGIIILDASRKSPLLNTR